MGNEAHEPLFPSYRFLGAFEALADQNLGLDILVDPGKGHDLTGSVFEPYRRLAARHANVSFGVGVKRSGLATRIKDYGFGLVLMRYDFAQSAVTAEKLRFALPNKLFGYLAAGLPVIVNSEFEAMARLVEENGLGLAVRSAEIGAVGAWIAAADYGLLRRNVALYQAHHNAEAETARLVGFYEAILDGR
jgi:hypothetical protein